MAVARVRNGWLVFEAILGEQAATRIRTWRPPARLHEHRLRHHVKDFGEDPRWNRNEGVHAKVLPEAFSPDGTLDDPRRKDITLGQLLCMTGGTGEGGAATAW